MSFVDELIYTKDYRLGVVGHLLAAWDALVGFDPVAGDPYANNITAARYHVSMAYDDPIWEGCEAVPVEFSQWFNVDADKARKDRAYLAMRDAKNCINDVYAGKIAYRRYISLTPHEIYAAVMNLLAAEGAGQELLDKLDEHFKANG
jgi:hypothetical protein